MREDQIKKNNMIHDTSDRHHGAILPMALVAGIAGAVGTATALGVLGYGVTAIFLGYILGGTAAMICLVSVSLLPPPSAILASLPTVQRREVQLAPVPVRSRRTH